MANVGDIAVIATLDTSRYKRGAREIDAANKDITGSTDKGGNAIEKLSGKLGSLAKTGVKVAAVGLAGLATTVAGLAVGGGISRALNIEDAQAKLKGLGHDAQSITKIMDSALASVKGTAYGLDAAATIAASAVAAGIKPGKELTKYLSLTADAATIAGVSLDEMGSIFNKVQTGQKAYTQELNQLADRGIPIYQWLQEELGVTQEELRDMVAAGEVDSETYFKAIQKNIGGAALESGKTTRGAFMNLLAALSRVGEGIVKGPIDDIRQGFNIATVAIDENGKKIADIAQGVIQSAKGLASGFVEAGKSAANYLAPKFRALGDSVRTQLIPALQNLWRNVLQPLIPTIGKVFVGAVGLAVDVMKVAVGIVSSLINGIRPMLPTIVGITTALVAYKLAVIAANTVNTIQVALLAAQQAQYVLLNGQLILVRGATVAQTIAQTALNTAMKLNPIGLVVAAIGGIISAYAVATQQTDKAKTATDRLNQARKDAKLAADNLKIAEDELAGAQLSAEGAALQVERAQRTYNDTVAQYGPNSLEAREAAYALKTAEDNLRDANDRVRDATDKKTESEKENAKKKETVKTAEAEKRDAFDRTTGSIRNQNDFLTTKLIPNLSSLNGRDFSYTVSRHENTYESKKAATGTGVPYKMPGQRYSGGPVSANRPYVVGENPDGSLNRTSELFVPRSAGRIINAKDLQSALSGRGGGVTNNIQNVNIASEVDGERWLRRLNGNQEIVSNGLVPTQSYM